MAGDLFEPEGLSVEGSPGDNPAAGFPIVGVGGSAGALEAFRDLLRSLPPETGMGFVYIQHLDPKRQSILVEIFSRETRLPVVEATEGLQVSPDHVYVLPPNRTMTIRGGILRLAERVQPAAHHLPIDEFFRSLADDQGAKGIAIVLSGASSDGALGLQAVKQNGGITFAQDDSAKHATMPHHAINTGAVDFVLPPADIAKELARIGKHAYVRSGREELLEVFPPGTEQFQQEIFALLHAAKGTDFSSYRPTTLRRRIARRMALHHTERIEDYARLVKENKDELAALFNEVLINVTSFFRDPDTFAAIAGQLLSRLVTDRPHDQPVRVWVPACSTGEEAYSLAIALIEAFGEGALGDPPIQIFGTDVSQQAIDRARASVFVENISMDVSPERLSRFFRKTDDHYRIIKPVRDLCVFACHDITRDPPFSNLDLVSCRNLLIYMSAGLQQQVIEKLHYALKPGGYLVLGGSESLLGCQDLFGVIDAKRRFFSKIGGAGRQPVPGKTEIPAARMSRAYKGGAASDADMMAEADRVLFARDGHSGVLIDGSGRILQFRGDTSRYLAPASGPASLDLLKMVRPELLMPLQSALQNTRETGEPTRTGEIQVRSNGGYEDTSLDVIPLKLPGTGNHYLVLFDAIQQAEDHGDGAPHREEDRREIVRLQQQLAATAEYLQAIIEELKGSHQEALSHNEELQSVNEEIETGKEELQSANEELVTVNEQLSASNAGLTQANADLRNLLASIEMPIVVLGKQGEIRMFTPSARGLFNFLASDVGRPIAHVRSNLEFDDLPRFVEEAVASGAMRETEVRDYDHNWYLVRATPSRNERDQIEGAILTLVDIGNRKRIEEEREHLLAKIQAERAQLEMVIQWMPSAVIVAEAPSGKIILSNGQVERLFGSSVVAVGDPLGRIHMEGFHPDGTAYQPDEWPFQRALQTGEIVTDEAIAILREDARVQVRANAVPIRDQAGKIVFAVATYEEITEVQELRERLAQTEKVAQSQKLETIGRLAGGVAHDFNNLLTIITGCTQFVLDDSSLSPHLREDLGVVVESANRAAALTSQLLAFSRRQTSTRQPWPEAPSFKSAWRRQREPGALKRTMMQDRQWTRISGNVPSEYDGKRQRSCVTSDHFVITHITAFIERHGYALLFSWVLAEQGAIPLPSIPLLVAAGALVRLGRLQMPIAIACCVGGALVADTVWFHLGRRRGQRVLRFLCRVALEPDSCVRRTENAFLKYGLNSLLVSKFVPGLNAVAAPLAGSSGARYWRFLVYDSAGAVIWSAAYLTLGFIFFEQLESVVGYASRMGSSLLSLVVGLFALWICWKFTQRRRFLKKLNVARITPEELRDRLEAGEDLLIVDLRTKLDGNAGTIPGALRIPAEDLTSGAHAIPRDRDIILFCS